ncbi:thiol S-methyltransferase TMT1B-like [Argiope bruennichi]|uniref:thiol S-methyltransferase TMT1B-like n=1 Tax=Argiope bruennichi TaxID=94029 RepID=UPI0024952121|nr:thiol S-methyltransferase TMT1B-like [Argiope bruennichi]
MEFLIYPAVTITLWMLSFSWLLPLVIFLKFSKTYRDKWFSWVFCKVAGPLCAPVLGRMRTRAFDILKEHLANRKRGSPLEILEIGIGGVSNLQYYPENSNLTVLDMNESFIKYFEENRKKYPQVTYKKTVIAMAEDMREIDDNSFDVVVCTYVLCSVKSVRSVLKEVKRVLKPYGGVCLMVWGIIPWFGVGPLATLHGQVTSNDYVPLLADQLHSAAQTLISSEDCTYHDDNSPIHSS